jgi:hypothetical protein
MRFYGVVGYGEEVETVGGVWEKVITEVSYFGDVLKNTRRLQDGEKVNSDISVGNTISIVADAYANEHFFAIKYVSWAGTLWTVSEVTVERPRLLLRLGGVYNGPTAADNSGAPSGTP